MDKKSSSSFRLFLSVIFLCTFFSVVPLDATADTQDWGMYRGVNGGPLLDESDIADLASTGANILRLSFVEMPMMTLTPPYEINEKAFDRLDLILSWCEKSKIKVVIDPHLVPGMTKRTSTVAGDPIWHDEKFHKTLISLWKYISERYKSRGSVIAGYDLLNEPASPFGFPTSGPGNWNALVDELVKTIRGAGDQHWIIVEPSVGRELNGRIINRIEAARKLRLPEDQKLIISPHIYQPLKFTHQGVHGNPIGIHYPGVIGGGYFDKSVLNRVLQPIVDFQKLNHVPVFIGEFSASKYAGADGDAYVNDLIALFEVHGWSWAYHQFRGASVWDAEKTPPDIKADGSGSAKSEMNRWGLLQKFYLLNGH